MNRDMGAEDNSEMNLETSKALAEMDGTLRALARVTAPEGLEERVHTALRSASRGGGRVIEFPGEFPREFSARHASDSPWMRTAAAAAICFVVVGGGWGVYSRVQTARVIAMPSHISAPGGGFSNAGAMRTPQTLNGPVINHPQNPQAANGAARVVPLPVKPSLPAGTEKKSPVNQTK